MAWAYGPSRVTWHRLHALGVESEPHLVRYLDFLSVLFPLISETCIIFNADIVRPLKTL